MGKSYRRRRKKGGGGDKKRSSDGGDGEKNNKRRGYLPPQSLKGNFKMECYYALQGLHDFRFDGDTLVKCRTDAVRNTERLQWKSAATEILPASFRIGKDVPEYYQNQLTLELEELLKEAAEYVPEQEEDDEQKEAAAVADAGAEKEKADTAAAAVSTSNISRAPEDPRRGPLDATATRMQKLSFLPHAYQLGLDRSLIRKNPALQKLHAWLKIQGAAGHVTRQETVSMIPPVMLNVQSTDTVLDMCAAPGSKTSQLLEDLSTTTTATSSTATDGDGDNKEKHAGVLVSNDANSQRAYLLVHQLRRVLHNHPVALVTACPAQFFPASIVQFDKILCDVPCSGDGTTRKNLGVWKSWSAAGALALHTLQLAIADKGAAQLLRVGGTMCYSTCSYNPVENEAVVAELLRRSNGALELIDYAEATASSDGTSGSMPLPGFRTRPGMNTWKVLCEEITKKERMNKLKKNNAKMQAKRQEFEQAEKDETVEKDDDADGEPTKVAAVETNSGEKPTAKADDSAKDGNDDNVPIKHVRRQFEPESMEEAQLLEMAATEGLTYFASFDEVPKHQQKRVARTCFPPTEEEVKSFHLERCVRCLPHDNDTGGFFVALLRKKSPMSATDRRQERKQQQEERDAVPAEDEPDNKKARLGSPSGADVAESSDSIEQGAGQNGVDDDVEDIEALDADNKPIKKQLKQNLVEGEDFGKDDFAAVSDEVMQPLIDYYGLSNGFDKDLYMARASSETKVIYYIAKPVKQLFDLGIQKRLTIVNSGLKGFMRNNRNNAECDVTYRVCQEGVHFLAPYMTKRKIMVGVKDFATCLGNAGKTNHLSNFSESFREQVQPLPTGSFVVVLDGYKDEFNETLMAAMWKCRGDSVDGLVGKVELEGMLNKVNAIKAKAESQDKDSSS